MKNPSPIVEPRLKSTYPAGHLNCYRAVYRRICRILMLDSGTKPRALVVVNDAEMNYK